MSENQSAALRRIASALEEIAREVRKLADEGGARPNKEKPTAVPEGFVERLRGAGRAAAVQDLAQLSHAQLGDVFKQVGGTSREKKRSRDWLIERILWNVFDLQAGHEIIKGADSH